MKNGNFRNNQMMIDIFVMRIEAGIEMDNVDETFLNEGMTKAFETPSLAVRKLYYDILNFSRADRRILRSVEETVNEIVAFAKDVENRITDREIASNDIIEYKENRNWVLRCYKL
jgi:hypothetical protein